MYDFDKQQVVEPKRQFTGVWIPKEVLVDERLSAVDKILYAEIASFGDSGCWKLSVELQQVCGIKRDGFQAACKRLRDCGYISESKNFGRVVRKSMIGFVQQQENPVVQQQENPVVQQQENPVVHIDNTIEYNNTNSELSKKLLELLNEKTKRNFRVLPRGWKETLKKFSLEEIAKALDCLAADSWHAGKLHELKSDYLLRASTIDNMLSRSKKQAGETGPDEMADLDELYGDGEWMKTL